MIPGFYILSGVCIVFFSVGGGLGLFRAKHGLVLRKK